MLFTGGETDIQHNATRIEEICTARPAKRHEDLGQELSPVSEPKTALPFTIFTLPIQGSRFRFQIMSMTVGFAVNYVVASVPTVPFDHPDRAKLTVLHKVLSSEFLHKAIREKVREPVNTSV